MEARYRQALNSSHFNTRPSSSQADGNHAAHYVLEFTDEVDIRRCYADELELASSHAISNYADARSDVARNAIEIKPSFQGATFTDSVSIQIIPNDINF